MHTPNATESMRGQSPDQVPSRLIGQILLLVLCSTLLSILLFQLLAPELPLSTALMGATPFVLLYGVSLVFVHVGWPRLAAHLFVWVTMAMQFMVTVLSPEADSQALVSYVNVVMAAGFMLGQRWALLACIAATSLVTASIHYGDDLRRGVLQAIYAQSGAFSGSDSFIVGLICTLLTTGGLAYLGLRHLSAALHLAQQHRATAESAALKLERAGQAEAIRAGRAEVLGVMARDIVALRSDASIAKLVASTLTSALDDVSTLVVGRDGRVLALCRKGSDQALDDQPDIDMGEAFHSSDQVRLLTPRELEALAVFTEGSPPKRGQLVFLSNSSVMLIVFGEYRSFEPHSVVWMLMAATNLLDASIQRNRMEHTLSQSQRMDALGRLSAGIAHDFNNLLTSILGGVELARRRPGDANQVGIYLDAIQGSTERAAGLTHKLMAFTSAVPQQPKPVDVGMLVEDMLPTLRRAVEESIEVEALVLDDEAWVNADTVDLERILVNLVVNAREALTSRGKIEVGVEIRSADQWMESADDAVVVLWVEDDGVGMPQDLIEHIFEPFFTTHKDTGASGLGLSIVYGLVHAMGGEIFVSSDPAEGTRFEVCLPHRPRPVLADPAPQTAVQPVVGHQILVVEDDEDVCATICGMLELAGYMVQSARDGRKAIELLSRDNDFSLVLSDVVMPEMGGFALYEAIQEMDKEVKMAFVSGYTPPSAPASGEPPNLPIISKPFSLNELVRFVGGVIG